MRRMQRFSEIPKLFHENENFEKISTSPKCQEKAHDPVGVVKVAAEGEARPLPLPEAEACYSQRAMLKGSSAEQLRP